ncbi:MAG: DUF2442 domain-containing protein [Leptolyngbyaceae cyanobacterium SL_5_9]|nr:DUF2442 domain-containing protein [Leptolyngbyaceae cyanobacterium SL_5_9]NJO76916.1 DUF2442 domain-containing protein [Leptolyngbyaceae cyanobacterium RM1_406_9]
MVEPRLDDLSFQQQIEQARLATVQANLTEPRAVSAHYDSAAELVIVRLQSGAVFGFPPEIAQGLAGAGAEELSQVEVTPMGDGLHWKILDADFSVAGLLAGVFGTKQWMANLQQRWAQQQAS